MLEEDSTKTSSPDSDELSNSHSDDESSNSHADDESSNSHADDESSNSHADDESSNSHSEEQRRLLRQYERVIGSKDKEIKEITIGLHITPTITLKLARTGGEMFRTKPKTKGGKDSLQSVNTRVESENENPDFKESGWNKSAIDKAEALNEFFGSVHEQESNIIPPPGREGGTRYQD